MMVRKKPSHFKSESRAIAHAYATLPELSWSAGRRGAVPRVSVLNNCVILLIENEQFGMLCSIDGQARQLIFRVADNNNNMSISRSYLTDSITSLSTISSLNQTNKTEVLQYLAKAIAEERCLPDKV
jgi:hypothetical protein